MVRRTHGDTDTAPRKGHGHLGARKGLKRTLMFDARGKAISDGSIRRLARRGGGAAALTLSHTSCSPHGTV